MRVLFVRRDRGFNYGGVRTLDKQGDINTMPSHVAVQASTNAAYAPNYLPVAVFTGGTSGIGQAMAEAFARYTKGRAHNASHHHYWEKSRGW